MLRDLVNLIRSIYSLDGFIPLHRAYTNPASKQNIIKCIDQKYLSIGRYVSIFENNLAKELGARYAIATNSGTAALNLSLLLSGIRPGDEVITQSFTYIATANAIKHVGAKPYFVDVNAHTMGMSPTSLRQVLNNNDPKRFSACLPMHTLGVKCDIEEIKKICGEYNIPVIVDACQAILSNGFFEGTISAVSFNGNKPITTGQGGAILTDSSEIEFAARKYLNQVGPLDRVWYNYRMPNMNAAYGAGIMEDIEWIRQSKNETAERYKDFAAAHSIECPTPMIPWLNAFFVDDPKYVKDYLSNNMIESRLGFPLINELDIYKDCEATEMPNAKRIQEHIIMLPSGLL